MQRADAAGGARGKAGGQLFSGHGVGPRPDRCSFLINKKNKKTEGEKKGNDSGGKKNGGRGRAKKGKKKKGVMNGSVLR